MSLRTLSWRKKARRERWTDRSSACSGNAFGLRMQPHQKNDLSQEPTGPFTPPTASRSQTNLSRLLETAIRKSVFVHRTARAEQSSAPVTPGSKLEEVVLYRLVLISRASRCQADHHLHHSLESRGRLSQALNPEPRRLLHLPPRILIGSRQVKFPKNNFDLPPAPQTRRRLLVCFVCS